jgi:hypothetical protein
LTAAGAGVRLWVHSGKSGVACDADIRSVPFGCVAGSCSGFRGVAGIVGM